MQQSFYLRKSIAGAFLWAAVCLTAPAQTRQPIGVPDDVSAEIKRIFLRESAAVLAPGVYEWETGIIYRYALDVFGGGQIAQRRLEIPLSLRAGLYDRFDGSVTVPLSYGYKSETGLAPDGSPVERTDSEVNLGDLKFGMGYLLMRETPNLPEVTLLFSLSIPTGRDPYGSEADEVRAATGSGHLIYETGIGLAKSSDPILFFGGLNYAVLSSESIPQGKFNPDDELAYNFGIGFAVSRVSVLSARFQGRFVQGFKLDGNKYPDREPMNLNLGLTARIARDLYLNPSVTFPLTQDASSTEWGVSLIGRLF